MSRVGRVMSEEPLVHDEDGNWRWRHDVMPGKAFDAPVQAVREGVFALQEAVDKGALSPGEARDVAVDARLALGSQEHHLGGPDAEAFQMLSDIEDEFARLEEEDRGDR